jgi:hypothetical protein
MPGLPDEDGISKCVAVMTRESLKEREVENVFFINKC